MKKFLLGLLVGVVLTFLGGFILLAVIAKIGDQKPAVADGSTIVYRLEGDVPEIAPAEVPFFGDNQPNLTVLDHYRALRNAATDSRIKAVVLEPRGVSAGWAKLEELREALLAYKKSGKPLIAWLRNPGTREYYLASVADKIYMTREDILDLKGLRLEAMFFKNTLDKVGAQMEIEHAGKYKDAGDIFTRTSLSPESKEALDAVLDGIYSHLLTGIAQGRKRSADQVRTLVDQGPFLAQQAKDAGLVDALYYEDEVYQKLTQQLGQKELKKLAVSQYVKAGGKTGDGKHQIAYLVGQGDIVRSSSNDVNNDRISSAAYIRLLRQVADAKDVEGVVLRVDSPGGDAIASDEILREVKLLSQKKPLVVSMSDLAASGGYYIASSGDPIVAYPNTLTGSIGVVFGKPNLHGSYDKLGIQKELLKRGQNSDWDSDYQAFTPLGRQRLRASIDEFYKAFVSRVAEGRKRPYEQVEPLAQGRVWLGSDAKNNGLVDQLGGLDTAIDLVKKKAKIDQKETVRLVMYPPKKSLLQQFMEKSNENQVELALRNVLPGLNPRLLRLQGMLQIMPYQIEIK